MSAGSEPRSSSLRLDDQDLPELWEELTELPVKINLPRTVEVWRDEPDGRKTKCTSVWIDKRDLESLIMKWWETYTFRYIEDRFLCWWQFRDEILAGNRGVQVTSRARLDRNEIIPRGVEKTVPSLSVVNNAGGLF